MNITKVIVLIISTIVIVAFQTQPSKKQIDRGRELSKSCVHCHGTTKRNVAYPLQRIRKYRTQEWLVKLVYNPAGFMSHDREAKAIFLKSGYIMPAFPTFSKSDINAVLDYLDSLPYNPENYKHREKWKPL